MTALISRRRKIATSTPTVADASCPTTSPVIGCSECSAVFSGISVSLAIVVTGGQAGLTSSLFGCSFLHLPTHDSCPHFTHKQPYSPQSGKTQTYTIITQCKEKHKKNRKHHLAATMRRAIRPKFARSWQICQHLQKRDTHNTTNYPK